MMRQAPSVQFKFQALLCQDCHWTCEGESEACVCGPLPGLWCVLRLISLFPPVLYLLSYSGGGGALYSEHRLALQQQ